MTARAGEFERLNGEFVQWCREGVEMRGPSQAGVPGEGDPSILERFCQTTGADEDVAHDHLQAADGVLERSLRAYTGTPDETPWAHEGTSGRFRVLTNNWDS